MRKEHTTSSSASERGASAFERVPFCHQLSLTACLVLMTEGHLQIQPPLTPSDDPSFTNTHTHTHIHTLAEYTHAHTHELQSSGEPSHLDRVTTWTSPITSRAEADRAVLETALAAAMIDMKVRITVRVEFSTNVLLV